MSALNPSAPAFDPEAVQKARENAEADALLKEAADVGTSGADKGGRKRRRGAKTRKSRKGGRKTHKRARKH